MVALPSRLVFLLQLETSCDLDSLVDNGVTGVRRGRRAEHGLAARSVLGVRQCITACTGAVPSIRSAVMRALQALI